MEIWGGIECTINRVNDEYYDQLDFASHYQRSEDLKQLCELGIKKIRYPILWEKHQPTEDEPIKWHLEENLNYLRTKGIEVIAGLVHHGSGPKFASIEDDNFSTKLAVYAEKVAEKFPWINYYTPINEPLTTARFCGLYGIWYPHQSGDLPFFKLLISECKATILAMQAIRKVNPDAQLVLTEDLGKIHSTEHLKDQAQFENDRRWLSIDLLCGKVNREHRFWDYMIHAGITPECLTFFLENPMPPNILGFNYYITSERFLDEDTAAYPEHVIGGNGRERYADVEAVRTNKVEMAGLTQLLTEAWERFKLPIAITEAHLHCTREEQLRWLAHIHEAAKKAEKNGVPIHGITIWSLLGAYGWDNLLTVGKGNYEAGAFDLRSGQLRPTALTKQIKSFSTPKIYTHPVLNYPGWWKRPHRILYGTGQKADEKFDNEGCQPLLIIGATGTLGQAFAKICTARGIHYKALTRHELDLSNPIQIEENLRKYQPWAVINAAGFVRVDDAELAASDCFLANTTGPINLAKSCRTHQIQLLTFSSDLVFDGKKTTKYEEYDAINPLNVYGLSKANAESALLTNHPETLIIRTSAFFSPWDKYNFVYHTLDQLRNNQKMEVAHDVIVSPTYVPDLVNTCLDLLIDEESGIWHLANNGSVSWYELAHVVAEKADLDTSLIKPVTMHSLQLKAKRPIYSALTSVRGTLMPSLTNAIDRFFQAS